ncbi:hypothetical protein [Promicromonospora sukumoe]
MRKVTSTDGQHANTIAAARRLEQVERQRYLDDEVVTRAFIDLLLR